MVHAHFLAGNLPVDLALSLAALITCLLYSPKARALDSPMLQASAAGCAVLCRLLMRAVPPSAAQTFEAAETWDLTCAPC